MIAVQLCGGLGNQMFQYAAGKAIASGLGTDIELDIRDCLNNPNRPYHLWRFHITPELLTTNWLSRKLMRVSGLVMREKSFEYDPSIQNCKDWSYLVGYFQSEKYFKSIEPEIRKVFSNGEKVYGDENSVAVHIRRGDYVGNPTFVKLSRDYYNTAREIIESEVRNPVYSTFSDDQRWATGSGVFEDLMAMARCKYHIIANSSLSWWGAWLCEYPDKKVIAPKDWFTDGRSTKDLIPDGWVRV